MRLVDAVKSSPRILYADDDACIRKLGERALAHCGYQVDTVSDGIEAWDALHKSNYDLLITDNEMPRLTGLKLAAQVRIARMLLPIVLASGSLQPLDDPATEWLSIAARLAKPFTVEELVATTEQVLSGSSDSRQKPSWMDSLPPRPASDWGINE